MELLPTWMQISFAVAVWLGAMFAVGYGIWWAEQKRRKWHDSKTSTFDD